MVIYIKATGFRLQATGRYRKPDACLPKVRQSDIKTYREQDNTTCT